MSERKKSDTSAGILDLRQKGGYTRKHLAASLGVTPQTVYNLETGRSTPSRRTRRMLEKTLGMDKLDLAMPYRGNIRQPEPGTFGATLREIREDRGLTLLELKEQSGVGIYSISNYELNKSKPSPDNLDLLAEALGFTPEDPEALTAKSGRLRKIT